MTDTRSTEEIEATQEEARRDMRCGPYGDCKDCGGRATPLYGVTLDAPALRCFSCAYSLRGPS